MAAPLSAASDRDLISKFGLCFVCKKASFEICKCEKVRNRVFFFAETRRVSGMQVASGVVTRAMVSATPWARAVDRASTTVQWWQHRVYLRSDTRPPLTARLVTKHLRMRCHVGVASHRTTFEQHTSWIVAAIRPPHRHTSIPEHARSMEWFASRHFKQLYSGNWSHTFIYLYAFLLDTLLTLQYDEYYAQLSSCFLIIERGYLKLGNTRTGMCGVSFNLRT